MCLMLCCTFTASATRPRTSSEAKFLSTSWRQSRGVGLWLHSLLTSALGGDQWPAASYCSFIPVEPALWCSMRGLETPESVWTLWGTEKPGVEPPFLGRLACRLITVPSSITGAKVVTYGWGDHKWNCRKSATRFDQGGLRLLVMWYSTNILYYLTY